MTGLSEEAAAAGDGLVARWNELAPTFSTRQMEAVKALGLTESVPKAAAVLEITPARVYAILDRLAGRLGVSRRSLREAARRRLIPPPAPDPENPSPLES